MEQVFVILTLEKGLPEICEGYATEKEAIDRYIELVNDEFEVETTTFEEAEAEQSWNEWECRLLIPDMDEHTHT